MQWQPKEITDFTVATLGQPAYDAWLARMLRDHQMLIIRLREELTPEQLLALTARFGDVQPSLTIDTPWPDNELIQVVKHKDTLSAGANDRHSSSYYWHTDRSFLQRPPAVTVLCAAQVPGA